MGTCRGLGVGIFAGARCVSGGSLGGPRGPSPQWGPLFLVLFTSRELQPEGGGPWQQQQRLRSCEGTGPTAGRPLGNHQTLGPPTPLLLRCLDTWGPPEGARGPPSAAEIVDGPNPVVLLQGKRGPCLLCCLFFLGSFKPESKSLMQGSRHLAAVDGGPHAVGALGGPPIPNKEGSKGSGRLGGISLY